MSDVQFVNYTNTGSEDIPIPYYSVTVTKFLISK